MSDSVRTHRWQPTRLRRSWDSPGKNTGMGCHFLFQCMKVKVKSLSRVQLLATPWTAAHQAPLSMGVSRQEYWSRLPLPYLGKPLIVINTMAKISTMTFKDVYDSASSYLTPPQDISLITSSPTLFTLFFILQTYWLPLGNFNYHGNLIAASSSA